MKILMIEDEKFLAEPTAQMLRRNNYSVDVACDGENGLDCALTDTYDIIILDIMLPRLDGLSILKAIRSEGINAPVILLTAKMRLNDKVAGLDNGADDYLTKPFQADELLARLRALARRKSVILPDGIIQISGVSLNPHTLTLSCQSLSIKLSLKEEQLLEMLMRRKNMVISKDQMIEKIWGYDSETEPAAVETQISLLRKKMRRIKSTASIKTIRGAGYVLEDNEVLS
ncbi:MAG: response regulator transcription factor [Clostridiales bacterium]|jgi:DNA-binding response OmpR family regulator|nr:response regulator transcription factor [Clostridiales bacterium]